MERTARQSHSLTKRKEQSNKTSSDTASDNQQWAKNYRGLWIREDDPIKELKQAEKAYQEFVTEARKKSPNIRKLKNLYNSLTTAVSKIDNHGANERIAAALNDNGSHYLDIIKDAKGFDVVARLQMATVAKTSNALQSQYNINADTDWIIEMIDEGDLEFISSNRQQDGKRLPSEIAVPFQKAVSLPEDTIELIARKLISRFISPNYSRGIERLVDNFCYLLDDSSRVQLLAKAFKILDRITVSDKKQKLPDGRLDIINPDLLYRVRKIFTDLASGRLSGSIPQQKLFPPDLLASADKDPLLMFSLLSSATDSTLRSLIEDRLNDKGRIDIPFAHPDISIFQRIKELDGGKRGNLMDKVILSLWNQCTWHVEQNDTKRASELQKLTEEIVKYAES